MHLADLSEGPNWREYVTCHEKYYFSKLELYVQIICSHESGRLINTNYFLFQSLPRAYVTYYTLQLSMAKPIFL